LEALIVVNALTSLFYVTQIVASSGAIDSIYNYTQCQNEFFANVVMNYC